MIKNLFAMTVLGAGLAGMAMAQAPAAAPAATSAAPTKVGVTTSRTFLRERRDCIHL